MEKVTWWNRPIEGRGEEPKTPKPTPPGIKSMGGHRPTTAKPKPEAASPAATKPSVGNKQ